ncbi:MAG: HAD-IA family hydrolase, partial [Tannerellaceae bacterium]|nr:HAD-IA family hydrolase [Tannerellaceae bacterium]
MIKEAIIRYLNKYSYSQLIPKAVLFDMDGVLYDSMQFHARAWHEVASGHSLQCTPADFYLFEGRTGDSTINELFQRTFHRDATPEEKKEIYKQKAALFTQYNDGQAMPGAKEVVEQVAQSGLQTLIVTGSGQKSLIEKINISYPGQFVRSKMVTGYDVKYGKPHPEPYLIGLEKAGVKNNEAIVIENAPLGVQSAIAAQIFTIAVNTGPLENKILLDAGANLLFPDMHTLAKNWALILKLCKEVS